MMKKSILMIDDDLKVCREIKYALQDDRTTDVVLRSIGRRGTGDLFETPFLLGHHGCATGGDGRIGVAARHAAGKSNTDIGVVRQGQSL